MYSREKASKVSHIDVMNNDLVSSILEQIEIKEGNSLNHDIKGLKRIDFILENPKEDDIIIDNTVDIIIIEGNYVSLKDNEWNKIRNFIDDSWFIQTPESLIRQRIIKRHLEAGISSNEKEAIERTDGNDMINAKYIIENSNPTNVVIITK